MLFGDKKNALAKARAFFSEEVRVNSEEVRGAEMRRRRNYKIFAKPIIPVRKHTRGTILRWVNHNIV